MDRERCNGYGMKRRLFIAFCLGACLVLMAGSYAPGSSGPEQAAALARKVKAIEGLIGRRHLAADELRDLSAALPDRVWLTEVVYDSDAVQVKGNALSNNLLADYISRLGRSPNLADVNLVSSVQRRGRNGTYEEFALGAVVRMGPGEKLPSSASPAERMEEFEKIIPARKDPAGALRQLQQAANDAGLSVTKLAPGSEIPREFYIEWPIAIEVTGSRRDLRQFLEGINDLPGLWLIRKFSFKAMSNEDADSPVRASLTAQTYILRDAAVAGTLR